MFSLTLLNWPTERGWNSQSCISFKRFFLQKEDSESDLKALDKMRSHVENQMFTVQPKINDFFRQ